MQYWINHNGVQAGPVDLEELKQMGLTSRAYVWHEGLADWVKITQLPELQGLYEMIEQPVAEGRPMVQPIQEVPPLELPPDEEQPEQSIPQPPQQYAQPQPPQQPQYAGPQPGEPCPPTNLVWAIISTVLCCLPAGIVAIVYATKVTKKYNEGDLEGAKRASEVGAWWCIISIVLGILTMPLMSMIQSMSMS